MGMSMARRTKRLWTVEEKRSICQQTTAAGVSVAQVARRYALNANVIFKWLRDPRFAPDPDAAMSTSTEPGPPIGVEKGPLRSVEETRLMRRSFRVAQAYQACLFGWAGVRSCS
jgi:transposase